MKRLLLALLRIYKNWVSPALPAACRYVPTCSEYAMEAVEEHGALRGSWLAMCRLARCHPFGGHGVDPVPSREQYQCCCSCCSHPSDNPRSAKNGQMWGTKHSGLHTGY